MATGFNQHCAFTTHRDNAKEKKPSGTQGKIRGTLQIQHKCGSKPIFLALNLAQKTKTFSQVFFQWKEIHYFYFIFVTLHAELKIQLFSEKVFQNNLVMNYMQVKATNLAQKK